MALVLRADCSSGDAYVYQHLTSLPSLFYVEFDVGIPSATFSSLDSNGESVGATNFELGPGFDGWFTYQPFVPTADYWSDQTPNGPFSPFTPDIWHTVLFEKNGAAISWTLDGIPYDSYVLASSLPNADFQFGGIFANRDPSEIYYIDNVKIGTTPGGADLFADDFESGSLSNWTFQAGAVSIVGDPFSGTPMPADDSYNCIENQTLNVAAPGVMGNDIFPTTASLRTGPSDGSLILNSDGSFSYTPNHNFLGTDTWTYDGNGGFATVTITVAAVTPRAIFDGAVGYKIAQ